MNVLIFNMRDPTVSWPLFSPTTLWSNSPCLCSKTCITLGTSAGRFLVLIWELSFQYIRYTNILFFFPVKINLITNFRYIWGHLQRERTENTYNRDKHGIRDFMQSSVDLLFFFVCIWDTSLLWYEKAPADIMALFFLDTKQT